MWTILFAKSKKKIVHIAFDVYAVFIHLLKKNVNSRPKNFAFFLLEKARKV